MSANLLNGLRGGLGGAWARLRRSGRRGAPAATGRTGPEGGRLYALWLWVLPLLLGLALGWLASVCIGIGLSRSGGVKRPAHEAMNINILKGSSPMASIPVNIILATQKKMMS